MSNLKTHDQLVFIFLWKIWTKKYFIFRKAHTNTSRNGTESLFLHFDVVHFFCSHPWISAERGNEIAAPQEESWENKFLNFVAIMSREGTPLQSATNLLYSNLWDFWLIEQFLCIEGGGEGPRAYHKMNKGYCTCLQASNELSCSLCKTVMELVDQAITDGANEQAVNWWCKGWWWCRWCWW